MNKFMKTFFILITIMCVFPQIIFADQQDEEYEKINQQYPYPAETPKAFIDRTLALLKFGYFYEDNLNEITEELDQIEHKKNQFESIEDAMEALEPLLTLAGGKHSTFLPMRMSDTADVSFENTVGKAFNTDLLEESSLGNGNLLTKRPYFTFNHKILHLYMPGFINFNNDPSKSDQYIHRILDAFEYGKAHGMKGIVLDLRENVGGHVMPMFAALMPILQDGEVFSENLKGGTANAYLINGKIFKKNEDLFLYDHEDVMDTPIAILLSEDTASSGEAMYMSLMGLENIRSFGQPTGGYNSIMQGYRLSSEYYLNLTNGMMQSRDGQIFNEEPIEPDVVTEHPMEDAIEWLKTQM
ncbi:S41 family peptidase [Facklamia sp. 7083-14-GEN3]|uniref:S41 family peptidase n=1 Tax=Facklamia sp. 7083-14-GEN3 TaxID=2973478 RepID=UPI00215D57C3|nr:S41 family peptidase [Facklamia sp. 7083-14-GEN3]MCR8969054.1 S41 family peptidase [Facklamia sp. 7083-14-GEN3]